VREQSQTLAVGARARNRLEVGGLRPVLRLDRKQRLESSLDGRVVIGVSRIDIGRRHRTGFLHEAPRFLVAADLQISVFEKLHRMEAVLRADVRPGRVLRSGLRCEV
jgi:hypothetical protein